VFLWVEVFLLDSLCCALTSRRLLSVALLFASLRVFVVVPLLFPEFTSLLLFIAVFLLFVFTSLRLFAFALLLAVEEFIALLLTVLAFESPSPLLEVVLPVAKLLYPLLPLW